MVDRILMQEDIEEKTRIGIYLVPTKKRKSYDNCFGKESYYFGEYPKYSSAPTLS